MGTIVVQAFITLDGVVQGGGGPDEDRDGGFEHGGWAANYDAAYGAAEDGQIVREWESRTEALLLGRRTYEIFAGSWGVWDEHAGGFQGELTRRYNRIPKYVASRTLTGLGWQNSQLLGPDVPAAVQELRAQPGGEIRVWGSTQLIRTLAGHGLVDEYRLVVYPLVLGTGKKLFSDGFTPARLTLAETRALSSGVLVNTYRRPETD
ncbi:dihydrofolate reductase family protein [Arthrobacter sp. I2-34]|uniref:Dihydrofolate reductase family protein n=1 Tax=Arthrobacter hankyongi TaxID=2904801 RepID=A0ABS9LB70_9MICC|nr:dihydrofolate reductase family protein [Arthrobacter hankyongi]MCG2623929.1 dihydrofolate reductase family protein [Arthrobacter hankyongi]